MTSKCIVSVLLLLTLLAIPAIAEFDDIDVNANGYNWVAMSTSEKEIFMALLYHQLGTDRHEYPENTIIEKLDDYYSLAKNKTANEQNKYLRIPVVVVFGWIADCKIEILDEHGQVKKVIHEPKN